MGGRSLLADAGLLQAWLDATDDGAIAVDHAGLVVLHNRAATRATALEPDAAVGRAWRDVLPLDGVTCERVWGTTAHGRRVSAALAVPCRRGGSRTVEVCAVRWLDADGRPGVLLVLRDLAVLCPGDDDDCRHATDVEERRSLLLRALSAHGGNRSAAARALGISRATFYRWWDEARLPPAGPDDLGYH